MSKCVFHNVRIYVNTGGSYIISADNHPWPGEYASRMQLQVRIFSDFTILNKFRNMVQLE